jgi:hypothetical protein
MINVYDVECNFESEEDAIEFLKGFVWGECEVITIDKHYPHTMLVDSYDGVELYYQYSTDSYYFVESV